MFDAKVLIKRLPIFQCSKNYRNPTRETNFKVAVNVANPNSLIWKNARTLKMIIQDGGFDFVVRFILAMLFEWRNAHGVTFEAFHKRPELFRWI